MPLRIIVDKALTDYFNSLKGNRPSDLYNLTFNEAELGLFEAIMKFADGNQSSAARALGINFTTLRKKLKFYGLL